MGLFGIPKEDRWKNFILLLAEFNQDKMKFMVFIFVGAFLAFPIGLLCGFILGKWLL